jgi:hypothetical protein
MTYTSKSVKNAITECQKYYRDMGYTLYSVAVYQTTHDAIAHLLTTDKPLTTISISISEYVEPGYLRPSVVTDKSGQMHPVQKDGIPSRSFPLYEE